MPHKPNILVVCGKNKRRSRTAGHLFKNDTRCNIRSAGLSPKSDRKISEKDLNWANLVLVMEQDHKEKIHSLYGRMNLPKVEVLEIEDEYAFMDEELVELLKERMNEALRVNFP